MEFLLDTNILIYFLTKNHPLAADFLMHQNVAISVLTRMELLAGCKKNEKEILEKLIDFLPNLIISNQVSDLAGMLIKKYSYLKRRQIDALIAATAIHHQLSLVTANVKDFQKINNLQLIPFKI